MEEIGGSREIAEDHGRGDFSSGKGVAATGICQAWQERGRVRGGEHGQQRVKARPGTLVFWDGER